MILVDGHLRREELAADALVPVLVLDVTEEEADRLLASMDPLSGMAVADSDALGALIDAGVIGEPELLAHLAGLTGQSGTPGNTGQDEIPPARRARRVKRGDLWQLGRHRLLCGDATRKGDVARLVGRARISLLWTDPPYGVQYKGKSPEALTLAGDHPSGLGPMLELAFAAADSVMKPGARIYVCHPDGPLSLEFVSAFLSQGWRLHQSLVWVKDRMVLGHADHHHRHELLLYGYKRGPGRWGRGHRGWFGGNDQDTVFEIDRPAASRDHPTAKPVALISRHLQNSSAPGEAVLDPFVGSGSTVIACEATGRRALALEIDALYAEVAIARFELYTGTKARRLSG